MEVRAVHLGWVDLMMASGVYQHRVDFPFCPGLEYCAEVCSVGDSADNKLLVVVEWLVEFEVTLTPQAWSRMSVSGCNENIFRRQSAGFGAK